MAVHRDPRRTYRMTARPRRGEVAFQVVVEQTDLHVVARRDLSREMLERVNRLRGELSAYIALHPEFGSSLAPVEPRPEAPEIARIMACGARLAGVGPMAAVAGVMARLAAEPFAEESPDIIVENGGDIFAHSTRERTIGILAEPESGSQVGLAFKPSDFPLALCASSGSIGHSLSFGQGDLVVVRSRDAALADAAATALANMIGSADDLDRVLERARELARHGLDGVFAQAAGKIGVWGRLELVAL